MSKTIFLCLVSLLANTGNARVQEQSQLGSMARSARLCHSSVKPNSMQPPSLFSLGDGKSCKEALILPANIHLQLLENMCKAAEQRRCTGNARGNLFKCLSVAALLHTLHKSHNQSCLFSMALCAGNSV